LPNARPSSSLPSVPFVTVKRAITLNIAASAEVPVRILGEDFCERQLHSGYGAIFSLRHVLEEFSDWICLESDMRIDCRQAYPRITIEGMEAKLRNEREASRFQAKNCKPRRLEGSRPVRISDLCMLDRNIT
jgi:hypothetical protein